MDSSNTSAQGGDREEPDACDREPSTRRWHRGPKGASVLDLIFKVSSKGGWSATLRSNPSVVLVAGDGVRLGEISGELALAILEGHGAEKLQAMREAGQALPAPEPDPDGAETRPRRRLGAYPKGPREDAIAS